MTQTITKRYMDEGLPGLLDQDTTTVETESLATGFIGQVSRFTIGDAAYTPAVYTITTPVTDAFTDVFDYDGSDDANATAAAVAMAAAWNASPASRALGIASVVVAKSVDIAWNDYTRAWVPVPTATNAAVFTVATQTAASSTIARFGVLVCRGAATGNPRDARPVAPLTSASVIADVRGMVIREDCGVEQPSLNPSTTSYDAYPAGRVAPILNRGRGWVVCETAMAVDGPIYVRKSGTGIIGAVRNDADGGTAIDASSKFAVVRAGVAGRVCAVKCNVPL